MREGHHYDLTRAEDREQTMRQIARTIQLKKEIKDPQLQQALFKAMSYYSESFSMRMYVHEMLFRQALRLFGTADQQDKWMDDIENWRVIGCFAMVRDNKRVLAILCSVMFCFVLFCLHSAYSLFLLFLCRCFAIDGTGPFIKLARTRDNFNV